jgi:hypothetical protein
LVTLCLHSARNGADNVQSLEDVERSLMLSGEIWAQAAALARELQAEDGLVAALSMTEAGRQRATELGLTSGVTGAWRLRTANGRPESIRLLEIVESRGYRRWRLIFNEMFPSRAYLAGHWPRAREGARGLAWTYLLRWLHLARAMPSAIRDVVATRRRV